MIAKFLRERADVSYFVFRVVIGLMFMMHGMQNLFGWFDIKYLADVYSLPWIGGIIMLVGGAFIVLGLWVEVSAALGAATMFVAYFWFHATLSNWWSPLVNHGESAMMYFLAMIILASHGAGKWALSKKLLK